MGWKDLSGSKQAGDRRIFLDEENRIQRINDPKYTSLFAYDDQGQRVVKYVKNNSANTSGVGCLNAINCLAAKMREVKRTISV
ncbi:MAG: hypothetical protein OEW58_12890 [Gammaproteobacteria bacterium]|nr:hypothetical protein [Gammaproteobacteria bacterium]